MIGVANFLLEHRQNRLTFILPPHAMLPHRTAKKNRQIFPAAMGSRPPKGGGCRHSLGEDKYGITLIGFHQSDRARFKGRQRKALCLWFGDFCFEAQAAVTDSFN